MKCIASLRHQSLFYRSKEKEDIQNEVISMREVGGECFDLMINVCWQTMKPSVLWSRCGLGPTDAGCTRTIRQKVDGAEALS